MATNYDSLITALQNTIKTNGTGAITGAVAQAAFLNVVESLTVGFQFMGVATPSTSPDSNDMKEYYIGFAGTYANFGSSVTVPEGSIILFKKDEGAWSSQVVKIADSVTVVDNTLSVGGVEKGELAGTIRNLPEWLYVVVDDENRVLFGVKTNGDFAFGSGCPPQIKEYINEKISELNISSYQDIVSFLGSLIEGDVTLSELLDKKIDGEYSTISEYLFAMVDSNNRVLFAIKTDGSIYFGKSLDRNSEGLKEYDRQIVNYILSVRDSIYFDISKTSDIISLNDPINMKRKLSQMYNSGLMIAHLSDLHGDAENFQRFVNFRNQYRTLIDDSIATGDIIWNKFGDDFDFWSLTETAKNIMISIGNHETCLTDENQVWSSASEQDVYEKFFAPFIDIWNVTHGGSNLYYYKDYTRKGKIRLIVLNPYYDLENQNAWLQNVLDDARQNGFSVVCAQHNPFEAIDAKDCSFTAMQIVTGNYSLSPSWGEMIESYVESVDAFQQAGGDFICWIAGHTHRDIISTHSSYPNQLMISVACATNKQSSGPDDIRAEGQRSQDSFNVYSFDTAYKTVTVCKIGQDLDDFMRSKQSLCVNYETKQIYWND